MFRYYESKLVMRMPVETIFTFKTEQECPLYGLNLSMDETHLYSIEFIKKGDPMPLGQKPTESDIHKQAVNQLTEYFAGRLQTFTVPLGMCGTAFQKKVWGLIAKIPYGQTRTYKEIAEAAGSSNLARAVGGAANRNPVPVIVPCHRVVGSSGSLTGFAAGVIVKQYLLDLEQMYVG